VPGTVITLRGEGNIHQLLRRAISRIEELGVDVLAVIDHSGDAADAGLTMPETKLVLVGNTKELTELMLAHPAMAIELPIKLLLRETQEGHVLISYHSPDHLADRYALTAEETDTLRIVDAIARQSRSNP
jgi:uncharacterized protein (DUF302 family)